MEYDIIVVGGGLAGSSLAGAMAASGARVLVVEKEPTFRDRVRGEGIHPWGVAEARRLGVYQPLLDRCAHEVRWWHDYNDDCSVSPRDLVESSPHRAGSLNFHHPEMQETLLAEAARSGAEVRRGVPVVGVACGKPSSVVIKEEGQTITLRARLVVGADGRTSRVRSWAGCAVQCDPNRQMVASVLVADLDLPEDAVHMKYDATGRQSVIIFPLGGARYRIYFIYRLTGARRGLSGPGQVENFIDQCIGARTPAAWYAAARAIGPLAEFSGAPLWACRPYRDGVVLIGDAAGAVDPSWGCGLSLALRDARVLSQQLTRSDDWQAGVRAYAEARDGYFRNLHRIEGWFASLLYDPGEEADARRARVFSRVRHGIPDIVGLGPDSPCDEAARRRFFAEG